MQRHAEQRAGPSPRLRIDDACGDHEAAAAGFDPVTTETAADDHKAYYPGSHRITIRVTGDRAKIVVRRDGELLAEGETRLYFWIVALIERK